MTAPRRGARPWLALWCLWLGCADDAPADGASAQALLGPALAVGTQLLVVDGANERAHWYAADADTARDAHLRSVDVPANPRSLLAREGHDDEALLLADGLRGVEQGATLSRLTADGEVVPFALGEAFDAVAQDPAGRFAVAFHRKGSDQLVFGAQQLAVVDLEEGEGRAHALAAPAGLPGVVAVSPELTLDDDSTAHVVAVGSPAHVALLGLDSLEARVRVVQLTGLTREPLSEPEQLLFDAARGRLLVRASHVDDLFVLKLRPAQERGDTPLVDVEQWPAGPQPSDLEPCGPAGDHIAVLTDGGRALWIFPDDGANPERIALAQAADQALSVPNGEGIDLLLYRSGSPWVGLARFTESSGAVPDIGYLRLDAPVQSVVELEGQPRALLVHDNTLVSVLDLERGERRLVNLRTGLQAAVQAPGLEVLWLGAPGQHLAAAVDLRDATSREVLLDAPIDQLVLVHEAERAIVIHPGGSMTWLDALVPSRETAVRVAAAR